MISENFLNLKIKKIKDPYQEYERFIVYKIYRLNQNGTKTFLYREAELKPVKEKSIVKAKTLAYLSGLKYLHKY